MTTVDGWLSWAGRISGPPHKSYPIANAIDGICLHSMEGWWPGSYAELINPERQASWMFSNLRDGRFYQHYPITASTWANGNVAANTRLWSVESEGLAGSPLTSAQVVNMLSLAEEFERLTGMAATRERSARRTLWEHNEVAAWAMPNAGPTACPSGRYAPFYAALEERDMAVDYEKIQRMIEATLDARKFEANFAEVVTNRLDAARDAGSKWEATCDEDREFRFALIAAFDLTMMPPEATP